MISVVLYSSDRLTVCVFYVVRVARINMVDHCSIDVIHVHIFDTNVVEVARSIFKVDVSCKFNERIAPLVFKLCVAIAVYIDECIICLNFVAIYRECHSDVPSVISPVRSRFPSIVSPVFFTNESSIEIVAVPSPSSEAVMSDPKLMSVPAPTTVLLLLEISTPSSLASKPSTVSASPLMSTESVVWLLTALMASLSLYRAWCALLLEMWSPTHTESSAMNTSCARICFKAFELVLNDSSWPSSSLSPFCLSNICK